MTPLPIQLSPSHRRRIELAAVAGYPSECCGLLIGEDTDAHRFVTRVESARNVLPEHDRADRFAIDPQRLRRAEEDATANGESVVGFYHSHPDHPARPSETDREAAWPFYTYLIVSVGAHGVHETNAWVLDDGTHAFVQQTIE